MYFLSSVSLWNWNRIAGIEGHLLYNRWLLAPLSLLPWMIRRENFLFRPLHLKIPFVLKSCSAHVFSQNHMESQSIRDWKGPRKGSSPPPRRSRNTWMRPTFSFGTVFILVGNVFSSSHVSLQEVTELQWYPGWFFGVVMCRIPQRCTLTRHPGMMEPFSSSGETQWARAADGEIKKKWLLVRSFKSNLSEIFIYRYEIPFQRKFANICSRNACLQLWSLLS